MSEENKDKVENLNVKNPVQGVAQQLADANKKKLNEELKKAVEEFNKALEVLQLAGAKVQDLEAKIKDAKPVDINAVIKSLGL